jgi:AAA domain
VPADMRRSPEAAGICSLGYPPKFKDVDDLRQRYGNEALVSKLEQHAKPLATKASQTRSTQPNWLEYIDLSTVTSSQLASLDLQPRRPLLAEWLCEGDYGIIYAPRGVGKTWLAQLIAKAISTGSSIGAWLAASPAKVLYFDGEMPPDLMRDQVEGKTPNAVADQALPETISDALPPKVVNKAFTGRINPSWKRNGK